MKHSITFLGALSALGTFHAAHALPYYPAPFPTLGEGSTKPAEPFSVLKTMVQSRYSRLPQPGVIRSIEYQSYAPAAFIQHYQRLHPTNPVLPRALVQKLEIEPAAQEDSLSKLREKVMEYLAEPQADSLVNQLVTIVNEECAAACVAVGVSSVPSHYTSTASSASNGPTSNGFSLPATKAGSSAADPSTTVSNKSSFSSVRSSASGSSASGSSTTGATIVSTSRSATDFSKTSTSSVGQSATGSSTTGSSAVKSSVAGSFTGTVSISTSLRTSMTSGTDSKVSGDPSTGSSANNPSRSTGPPDVSSSTTPQVLGPVGIPTVTATSATKVVVCSTVNGGTSGAGLYTSSATGSVPCATYINVNVTTPDHVDNVTGEVPAIVQVGDKGINSLVSVALGPSGASIVTHLSQGGIDPIFTGLSKALPVVSQIGTQAALPTSVVPGLKAPPIQLLPLPKLPLSSFPVGGFDSAIHTSVDPNLGAPPTQPMPPLELSLSNLPTGDLSSIIRTSVNPDLGVLPIQSLLTLKLASNILPTGDLSSIIRTSVNPDLSVLPIQPLPTPKLASNILPTGDLGTVLTGAQKSNVIAQVESVLHTLMPVVTSQINGAGQASVPDTVAQQISTFKASLGHISNLVPLTHAPTEIPVLLPSALLPTVSVDKVLPIQSANGDISVTIAPTTAISAIPTKASADLKSAASGLLPPGVLNTIAGITALLPLGSETGSVEITLPIKTTSGAVPIPIIHSVPTDVSSVVGISALQTPAEVTSVPVIQSSPTKTNLLESFQLPNGFKCPGPVPTSSAPKIQHVGNELEDAVRQEMQELSETIEMAQPEGHGQHGHTGEHRVDNALDTLLRITIDLERALRNLDKVFGKWMLLQCFGQFPLAEGLIHAHAAAEIQLSIFDSLNADGQAEKKVLQAHRHRITPKIRAALVKGEKQRDEVVQRIIKLFGMMAEGSGHLNSKSLREVVDKMKAVAMDISRGYLPA